jgi:transcriptional regulator with XRE-family HTH domain
MVCDKIKMLRESRDWTQSELAKKLGLTRSAVNAWEMGLSVPSTPYIVELATLFKITTDSLLGEDSKFVLDITDLRDDERVVVIGLVNSFLRNKENKE